MAASGAGSAMPTQKLGPFFLSPGVTRGNALVFFFAALLSIGLFTFLNTIQPYILTEHLGLPDAVQGRVSGNLLLWQELVILVLVGPFGALSDRIGRRAVYMAGFFLIGLGYGLYPFASTVNELIAYRVVFAIGAAAVTAMLATVLADYPQERSRGKFVAVAYMLNGIGVLIFAIFLARLPAWFAGFAPDARAAGQYSLLIVAAIAIIGALVLRGLRGGVPEAARNTDSMVSLLMQGMAAGKNARISLAYGTAFVSRGDLAVVGTFLLLWAVQTGIAQGATTAEATKNAGILFAIVQGSALLWAPIFGTLADKLDRVTLTAVAMLLAGVGYGLMATTSNPIGTAAIPLAIMLGIGQMSAILASQTLIGQEAPEARRGSVLGVYSFFGALGILFVAVVGGRLFDTWTPAAPFILVAVGNILLGLWALAARIIGTTPAAQPAQLDS
ncbi:MAG: MFS transporter [Gammaproteobacteria bacterium]|nr:MFS transporter [Gammaproteobacteria bacterium]